MTHNEAETGDAAKMIDDMKRPPVKAGQIWKARNGDVLYVYDRDETRRLVGDAIDRGNAELFPFDVVNIAWGCVGTVTRTGTFFNGDTTHKYDLVEYLGGPPRAPAITGKPIENPTDPAWLTFLDTVDRKTVPLATGLFDYFPDALCAVAHCSHVANEQHNPGQPVHWNRDKSQDHDDCMLRHFRQRGTIDTDKVRHRTKVAWRALAALQIEIEQSLKGET